MAHHRAARLLFAAALLLQAGCDPSTDAPTTALPGWTLVWSDEFDTDGLPDAGKWGYDVGDHGWGNQELQNYLARNPETARVEEGHLIITASLTGEGDSKTYPSARLVTKNKGDWTYGRVEVRAKIPRGRGTWPAIWMLPTANTYGTWPASGEIDIMEHVGFDPTNIHGTVHTSSFNHTIGTQKGEARIVPTALDAFHVYAIEWRSDRIDFFVDSDRYFTFANTGNGPADWPFDQPFHLVMNIAVGGSWGGQQGVDDTIFPQEMQVDYVRVYREE
ncbi:MAG: glycoside hydrolase family 16 protein [Rhodothermales bacterium]